MPSQHWFDLRKALTWGCRLFTPPPGEPFALADLEAEVRLLSSPPGTPPVVEVCVPPPLTPPSGPPSRPLTRSPRFHHHSVAAYLCEKDSCQIATSVPFAGHNEGSADQQKRDHF